MTIIVHLLLSPRDARFAAQPSASKPTQLAAAKAPRARFGARCMWWCCGCDPAIQTAGVMYEGSFPSVGRCWKMLEGSKLDRRFLKLCELPPYQVFIDSLNWILLR